MGNARSVARAFSPLDEELDLLPGSLTPRLAESVVRMGTWMPFGRAAQELEHLLGVQVSEASVRRLSERAGASYVAVQEEEVERLERELPPAPAGPPLQLLSVDGAMVPLLNKQWAEVKTLAVGEVSQEVNRKGERLIRTKELSYFSRCSEASVFARQAVCETHRRGVESAKQVSAVADGAEWVQGFIDYHRLDAVRILDFPHATEHLAEAGRASFGEQSNQFPAWLDKQRHELRHGSSEQVLAGLSRLRAKDEAAREVINQQIGYFEKRQKMIRYAEFEQAGYPIGSGSVESANKLVVEARLKQAGMHWAAVHVNPMVALRNVACNDRWQEAWPQIVAHQQQARQAKKLREHPLPTAIRVISEVRTKPPSRPESPSPEVANVEQEIRKAAPKQKYRPPADHPWRRFNFGKRFRQNNSGGNGAKL
jgi:hypothetical protein